MYSPSLQLLLGLCLISRTVLTRSTLGQVDREQLETYEDLSGDFNDLDLFSNLTFRFSCDGKATGLYADQDYACRIFHVCEEEGRGFQLICSNDTLFDQRQRICERDENVDCERAHEWYYLNELPYSTETMEMHEARSIGEEEVHSVLPLLSP